MKNLSGSVSSVVNNILFLNMLMMAWKKVGALLDDMISEIELLKSENHKLRNYISLISAEIELKQRITEIKQNFANSTESERIIMPIVNRVTKIYSEKLSLEKELNLN